MDSLKVALWIGISCIAIYLTWAKAGIALNISKKNRRKSQEISNDIKSSDKDINPLINSFNFPICTFDTRLDIHLIHETTSLNQHEFATFLEIIDISDVVNESFFITANFVGNVTVYNSNTLGNILPEEYINPSFLRLFSGNMRFEKTTVDTISIFMEDMPENRNHDFYIKDFKNRFKEILEKRM